jgi:hypothetical protein
MERGESSRAENESPEMAFQRIIPELELELLTDFNSVRAQLGIEPIQAVQQVQNPVEQTGAPQATGLTEEQTALLEDPQTSQATAEEIASQPLSTQPGTQLGTESSQRPIPTTQQAPDVAETPTTPSTTPLPTSVSELSNQTVADIAEGDTKVFGGVREGAVPNEGFLWFTTDKEVAKDYQTSEFQGEGEGIIQEFSIEEPQNSLELGYKTNTEVRGSDLSSLLDNLVTDQVEKGTITPEEGAALMDSKINEFKEAAGENLEKWHTKINKPGAARIFAEILTDLGYDSVKVFEGPNSTKPTIGLIKKPQVTVEGETQTESVPKQTASQKQSGVERTMADEALRLQKAVSDSVNEALAGLRGGAFNRVSKAIDENKFIQAVDALEGDNAKKLAKRILDVANGSTRVPKQIRAALEKFLGEPIRDFVERIKTLQNERESLTAQAVEEQQQVAKQTQPSETQQAAPKKEFFKDTDDVVFEDLEPDGLIGLTTADINAIRDNFDMEATKVSPKTVNKLIVEARQYMSTPGEGFIREAPVVHELLQGSPVMDLDAKMIAIRRAIDHMESTITVLEKNREGVTDTQALREQNRKINELRDDLHDFTTAYNKIGTIGGRILRFRQERLKSDFYSPQHLRDLMVQAKNGEKLTPTENAFVNKKSKELKELSAEIDRLNSEVALKSEAALKNIASRAIVDLKKKQRGRRKKSKLSVADASTNLRNILKNGPC